MSRLAAPILARHGGGTLARLKLHWAAAIGPELAAVSWPEALARGGVLKLRVLSAHALDIQHRTPQVVERINAFFGREAVSRLVLVQGPLPLPPAGIAAVAPAPPTARDAAALDRQVAAVDDPELRAALAGLGRAVIGAERKQR